MAFKLQIIMKWWFFGYAKWASLNHLNNLFFLWCTVVDSKFMFKAQPTKSLIQLYKQLSEKLLEALTTPSVSL